ncbi:ATP-dependent DNA helicase PIF1-like protein [Tanacetum coccineum]
MAGDGVAGIKRRRRDLSSDGVRNMAMASGRGRLKEDIELSTWRWILKVRDCELGEPNNGEVSIDLLEEILMDATDDPVTSIIDFTYPNILDNMNDPSYLQEKAILAPMNEVVDNINEHLLEKFPRE